MNPKVSVCLITYNHENYIEKAIQGILNQKTDFEFEIIVGDDLSTDGTSKIIESYQNEYPKLFKVLPFSEKMGMHRNWDAVMLNATGTYLALLEGDDYWIDPLKLAKQVEIMDSNPKVTLSFTNASIIDEIATLSNTLYVDSDQQYSSLNDLLQNNFIPTCTVMYRNKSIEKLPEEFFKSPFADWIVHCLYASKGQMHFMNDVTAVYRIHNNGVYQGTDDETKISNKIKALTCINNVIDSSYSDLYVIHKKELLSKLLVHYKRKGAFMKYVKTYIKKRRKDVK
jgi:glycosyltransferase involved in cell wall biosynthesis